MFAFILRQMHTNIRAFPQNNSVAMESLCNYNERVAEYLYSVKMDNHDKLKYNEAQRPMICFSFLLV